VKEDYKCRLINVFARYDYNVDDAIIRFDNVTWVFLSMYSYLYYIRLFERACIYFMFAERWRGRIFSMFQVVSWTRYRLFFLFMAIHIRGVPEIHLTELPWPPTDALLSSPSIFVLACLVSSSNTYSLKQTVPSYRNAGHVLQPFAIILFDCVRVCRQLFTERWNRTSFKEIITRFVSKYKKEIKEFSLIRKNLFLCQR